MKTVFVISALISLALLSNKGITTSIEDQTGKQLAQLYCQSCHMLPNPKDLNKATWANYVLPRMGYMLGIYEGKGTRDSILATFNDASIEDVTSLFPDEVRIDPKEWQSIKAYYLSNSPISLPIPKDTQRVTYTDIFNPRGTTFTVKPPSTTLVKYLSSNDLLIGTAQHQKVLFFDNQENLIKSGNAPEGVVSAYESNDALYLTAMGSFAPSDQASGKILQIPKNNTGMTRIVASNLNRPVHTSYSDLDLDGKLDIVVSEYGKWLGKLSINWGNQKGFLPQALINQTGAIKTQVEDMNGDNLPDVVSLFGQGNECIRISYNLGNRMFRHEEVLKFKPSNGSSSFEMVDWNKDGHLDIIYTAGDNADYPPISKSYHGIYLYLNNGMNQFKLSFFLPMQGAYGAKAVDFDQDGDLDIASISFFADYNQKDNEGFIYWQNIGKDKFRKQLIPQANKGRWLVMDTKDKDNDGDVDIVLGSLAFEVVPKSPLLDQWVSEGIPYLVLENLSNNVKK